MCFLLWGSPLSTLKCVHTLKKARSLHCSYQDSHARGRDLSKLRILLLWKMGPSGALALKNLKKLPFSFSSWFMCFCLWLTADVPTHLFTPIPSPSSALRNGRQKGAIPSVASRGHTVFSLHHCLPVLFLGLGLTWKNCLTMEPSDPRMEARDAEK